MPTQTPVPSHDPIDQYWMQQALKEAQCGFGTTSPNPPVGAVIVADGQCIAKAYHPKAGQFHAERRAILQAQKEGKEQLLQGATIYITLEPCSSWGKTPPCTQIIIESGIKRVVYACKDPDLRHRGRADALLKAEGITVLSGVCEPACAALLRPWAYAIQHERPWVIAKVATSMDARLSRKESRWLSGQGALQYAHQLRAQSDAILIGGNTMRNDNPSLTIRQTLKQISPYKEQPLRIVVTRDKKQLIKDCAGHALLCDEHRDKTIIIESVQDWYRDVLHPLYKQHGVIQLMVEAGGTLITELLNHHLINEWVQNICPYISGGPHQLITQQAYLEREIKLQQTEIITCKDDIILKSLIADH